VTGNGITCVLADDHPAVVDAVGRFLEKNGIVVVDHARDSAQAVSMINTHKPDVALVDLNMPGVGGIEVVREIQRTTASTAAMIYTGSADAATVQEALDAGARGLVLKGSPLPDVVRAVETAAAGKLYIDPLLAAGLASRATPKTPTLSKREREILRYLSHGLTNEDIGRQIYISPETVRTHVRRAIAKLGARTRTQAVATALRRGLIS
jgi:DNA-binding NarL/FixJ family response regulator